MTASSRLSRTPRVAIMFDNFGPYHVARLAGAATRLDVVALEASPTRSEYAWDRPRLPSGMDYVALAGSGGSTGERRLLHETARRLFDRQLDAIALPGWSSYTTLALLREARAARVPAILMSESNAWDFTRRRVSEAVKRGVVAHFAAGLATSDSQVDYLVALGLPHAAIFRGYNAVDNAFFADAAQRRAAGPMPYVEDALLSEGARGRYFLTSNRFIEKKNLVRLLRAYAAFRRQRSDEAADWPLVLVGDGEQRAMLVALRRDLALERHVRFAGFRQIDELPDFYATAGAFVHASTTEQWGLVVNEAMASGLPVAISSRCGCAEVLVDDGRTGFVFEPLDEAGITALLDRIAVMPGVERAAMVDAARARIAQWGPERFGDGIARAVDHACANPLPRPGLTARAALLLARGQRIVETRRNAAGTYVRSDPANAAVRG